MSDLREDVEQLLRHLRFSEEINGSRDRSWAIERLEVILTRESEKKSYSRSKINQRIALGMPLSDTDDPYFRQDPGVSDAT